MTERLHFHFSDSCIGEGNGNPLQCSCLENPRVSRREEILAVRAEINAKETKETIAKSTKPKAGSLKG